jgi:isocitrate dehydrogenase
LADQTDDSGLQSEFVPIAQELDQAEETIVSELNSVQGAPADLSGYYLPDAQKASAIMRPSAAFNKIIDNFQN